MRNESSVFIRLIDRCKCVTLLAVNRLYILRTQIAGDRQRPRSLAHKHILRRPSLPIDSQAATGTPLLNQTSWPKTPTHGPVEATMTNQRFRRITTNNDHSGKQHDDIHEHNSHPYADCCSSLAAQLLCAPSTQINSAIAASHGCP